MSEEVVRLNASLNKKQEAEEQLRTEIESIRATIGKLTILPELEKYVGKYFKYKNKESYNRVEFFIYIRIVSVDEFVSWQNFNIECFQTQGKHVLLRRDTWPQTMIDGDSVEITEQEFESELEAAFQKAHSLFLNKEERKT